MESNIIKMQGNDGKEYALTLSFAKLYKLEKARPEEAQRYFENCGQHVKDFVKFKINQKLRMNLK